MANGYGTFDLGSILRDAEAIKSYQRGSRLDDLREISMREGIETQRAARTTAERQYTEDQRRQNSERFLVGVQLAQKDPEMIPMLISRFSEGENPIINPDAVPQLVQRAQQDPEGFLGNLKTMENQLRVELAKLPEKSGEAFTLSPGQTRFDAQGNPVASVSDPEAEQAASLKAEERLDDKRRKNLETEEGLRKEFNDLTKDFRKVSDAYARVEASAAEPSAAGDLALIFNYMKILDPGSTVREGEFANAENSGGVPARIVAKYNKVIAGERLSDEIRNDFVERAAGLYNAQFEEARKTADQYKTIAEDAGVKADNVIATLSGREAAASDAGQPAAGGAAPDGTVIQNAQGQSFVKQNGQWVQQ